MKFSIVKKRKHKLIWELDFRKIMFSIASVFLLGILSVLLNFIPAFNTIFAIICICTAAVYSHYSNNIFSYVHYFDVVGDIDFVEYEIKINDEAFGYEKIQQIKIFIGFYKNYQKAIYSNHLWDGISRIEFYLEEKQMKYSFIIHSKDEYVKFEKLLMELQSRYTIQILDNFRRDNMSLPVLSR